MFSFSGGYVTQGENPALPHLRQNVPLSGIESYSGSLEGSEDKPSYKSDSSDSKLSTSHHQCQCHSNAPGYNKQGNIVTGPQPIHGYNAHSNVQLVIPSQGMFPQEYNQYLQTAQMSQSRSTNHATLTIIILLQLQNLLNNLRKFFTEKPSLCSV